MKPGEIKAKNVLEKVYPDKYKNLLICDKPDLQDEFNCIGVEVTYGILSENNEKGVYEKYNKEINNAREEDIKLITNCLDELLLECCDKPETKKKFFQSLKSYLPENKIEKIYNEIVETNKIEMDNDFFRDKKLPNKVIHKLNIDNCLDDNDKQRLLSVTKSIISIRKQGYTTIHSGYVGKVFRVKDSFLLDPFCDKLDKLNKIESNHNLGYKIFQENNLFIEFESSISIDEDQINSFMKYAIELQNNKDHKFKFVYIYVSNSLFVCNMFDNSWNVLEINTFKYD